MKRTFWIWLTALLLVLCIVLPAGAEEIPYSGTCGDNATWAFDATTGTLTISGTGPMADSNLCIWRDQPYKEKITRVVVESGITAIGKNAFEYLDHLTEVQLADTVTRIEGKAFALCWRLPDIRFPNSVQYIGSDAFCSCSSLTSLVLPESLTACGAGAFSYCSKLTSVTLPNSLEKLPSSIFSGCDRLTSITIPAGVKELGAYLFGNSSKINLITFLGDAPVFHPYTFDEITAAVLYPAANSTWTGDKRKNYDGTITWVPDEYAPISGTFGRGTTMSWKLDQDTLTITGDGYMNGWTSTETPNPPWYPYRGMIKKVVLSGKIENIYTRAFQDCTKLTDIVWVPTVTSIHDGAFRGCTSLTSITIPDTVEYMYDNVFSGCTALRTVKLSNALTELSASVFRGCTSLKTVTVPASVNNLWRWIFAQSAVETVYFQGNMPGFQGTPFTEMEATLYYAANNSTWTADKIKAEESKYGGKVKFVATTELNKYTQHQQFVEDPKPSTGAVSGGNTSGSNGSSSNNTPPKNPETPQQTTAPTENTGSTQPETTQPVEQTGETTVPTVPADQTTSEKEHAGAWFVWLAVGLFVAADTVVGVIYLKKRKNKKQ